MKRRKTYNVRLVQWRRYQRYINALRTHKGVWVGGIAAPQDKCEYEQYWLRRGQRPPNYWRVPSDTQRLITTPLMKMTDRQVSDLIDMAMTVRL